MNNSHTPHDIARLTAGIELQHVLVTLIDLSLIGKHARWNVVGPGLRSLHLDLDELIDAWRDAADAVGERIAALGGFPDGRAKAVAARSELPTLIEGPQSDLALVASLTVTLVEATRLIRARMNGGRGLDPVSADLVRSVVATLEEQLWMLRANAG